ncbi:hypothetical protein [Rhodococcus sp. 114MFTsu3.1]|uniref:hypothetical protein n=1 Tax=Rhodococcus sp. 114MFTsu3.1 TaxID=1172184 RepID=UPI00037BA65A|nr:hypothetical protein [Rhodococcus sp. 114MFTsu3.1]
MSNTTGVGQPSAYDLLVESAPQFVQGRADDRTVSLLGQAVADVLTSAPTDRQLQELVETFEQVRSTISSDSGGEWNASIVGFLGLLRQHLRNRHDRSETANPTSATLRAKVLTALEAGFSNPTAISGFVDSPVTVVSRTLRKLVDEGRVERRANEGANDGRVRNYDVVSQPAHTLTGPMGDPDEAELSSIEPSILIPFAERQIRTNPMTATELVPDLVAVGRRQANSPSDRVAALSAASVITRATAQPDAAGLASDLAQVMEAVARDSADSVLLACAAYESVRSGIVARGKTNLDEWFAELDAAELHIAHREDAAACFRRGWIEYTRGLLHGPSSPEDAEYRCGQAVKFFEKAESDYGRCASLILIARSLHHRSEGIAAVESAEAAVSIAQKHNYVRLLAESSLWLGEALVDQERARAQRLFRLSSDSFKLCGARSWYAVAECSREMASALQGDGFSDASRTIALLQKLVSLRASFASPEDATDGVLRSWAYACISRRIGVVARHVAGERDAAIEYLSLAAEIYSARRDGRGLALALAGLSAAFDGRSHLSTTKDSFDEFRDWQGLDVDPVLADYKALDRDLYEAEHRPTAELKAV